MNAVSTVELFLPLQTELVALLRGLSTDDWQRPTVAGSWRVKDVVAHLLDGDLRRLSSHRDAYSSARAVKLGGYDEIVAFINDLNRTWVDLVERFSPRLLVDLLEWTGPQVAELFGSLDPDGEAIISVLWAGESRSTNWMDVGREYTERWHHQAQIRDAVAAPLLLDRRWLGPVLDLSMYALPYAFRGVEAPEGATLNVTISGDAGGRWFLVRDGGRWRLGEGEAVDASASVETDADSAWRLLYNALPRDEAERRVATSGDADLCSTFLTTRSVMV